MSFATDFALGQTAEWRKAISPSDHWGKHEYEPAVMIRCRFVPGRQEIGDLMGNAIQADFTMIADKHVEPGDLVIYGGVTYEVSGYTAPPWFEGEDIGRFSHGKRIAVDTDGE